MGFVLALLRVIFIMILHFRLLVADVHAYTIHMDHGGVCWHAKNHNSQIRSLFLTISFL
jgi:hypothetical protein